MLCQILYGRVTRAKQITLEPKYHGRVTRGNQITLESKYHSSALGTQVVRTRLNSPTHPPSSCTMFTIFFFLNIFAIIPARKDFVFNLFAITPAHGKIPSHHGPCSRNNLFFSFFARIHALGKIPPRLDPLRRHICF